MVQNDIDLKVLCLKGLAVPFIQDNLSGCSIDLTLGDSIKIESLDQQNGPLIDVDIKDGYTIRPKQFFLAHTREVITIPDGYSAQLLLRSSTARAGLDHLNAGWIDPSFSGQITLECVNVMQLHDFEIKAGMRLVQLIVFKNSGFSDVAYSEIGNYQDQRGTTASNMNLYGTALKN